MNRKHNQRKGAAALLICIMLVPLLSLLAFSVDYGYLLYIRTDLQRVADQAALAGVRDLVPDQNGQQDESVVRDRVREYVKYNLGSDFAVSDSDIELGKYDPATIYSSVSLLATGTKDTVRVTLRREQSSSVSLFFARIFGKDESGVNASGTAVLQRAQYIKPGSGVFPFAMPKTVWDAMMEGEDVSIYGDGKIEDGGGNSIPGNYGTVDIGPTNNSTKALRDQITGGLTQDDLDSLYAQGAIPTSEYIDANQASLMLNADPGFSAGIKHAVQEVHGHTKLIPIYDTISGGGGNNAYYDIVGWGVVQVVDSTWKGSKNSAINIKKLSGFDGQMKPSPLDKPSDAIDGLFTTPVLVE